MEFKLGCFEVINLNEIQTPRMDDDKGKEISSDEDMGAFLG